MAETWDPQSLYAAQSGWQKVAPTAIITGSSSLSYVPLNQKETEIFHRDYRRLIYVQALERDLSPIFDDEELVYFYAAGIAKGSIGTNPTFAGNTPGASEIGMQLIRAVTVLNPGIAAPPPVLSWTQTYAGAGWTNIFGSSTVPVDLSQTGVSGATNLQNRVMMCITALINPSVPPLVAEYRWHIQNVDYTIHPITWETVTDLSYVRLSEPIIAAVNSRFYMRGNIEAAGTDQTQLFGITFATGAYLTYET